MATSCDYHHIVIGVPAYGHQVHNLCAKSIFDAAAHLHDQGIATVFLTNTYTGCGLARNKMTADFLNDTDATHIMWVDADLSFEPDAISRLLAHNLDVVGGLYPFKRLPIEWPLAPVTDEHGRTRRLSGSVVEVEMIGGGFVLVRREVYLTMMQMLPELSHERERGRAAINFYPEMQADGRVASEDLRFCELWRARSAALFGRICR